MGVLTIADKYLPTSYFCRHKVFDFGRQFISYDKMLECRYQSSKQSVERPDDPKKAAYLIRFFKPSNKCVFEKPEKNIHTYSNSYINIKISYLKYQIYIFLHTIRATLCNPLPLPLTTCVKFEY